MHYLWQWVKGMSGVCNEQGDLNPVEVWAMEEKIPFKLGSEQSFVKDNMPSTAK